MEMDSHPLLLAEVLEKVFQHLNLKDLFSCRVVNSIWNNEASKLIGSIIKTSITEPSHFTSILELTKSCPTHPYRTFELQDVKISFDDPLIEDFFTVCGPYIHHLTIWYNREVDDGTISARTFRDILLYYVPNLKSLTLQYLPHSIFSKEYVFPPVGFPDFFKPPLAYLKSLTIFSDLKLQQTFLEDILSLSSSIENITVKFGIPPGEFKKRLLAAMQNKKNNLKNMKSLKYFMHDPGPDSGWSWSQDECKALAKMSWKLGTLKLNPSRSDSDSGFLYLMESIQNSLVKLTLRVHHPLRFPTLNLLVHLTLYDYEENLKFLEHLPSLRYLGLCEYFPSKTVSSDNIITKQSASLTSLNLYGSTVSDHLFKTIIMCLPNLRNLNVWHCNSEKFRTVLQHSSLLEELIINCSEMDDESMTGISASVCDQIERRLKNKASYNDFSNELSHRDKPFIGDLIRLQRLELHGACLADWRWSNVGDVSLIFGIACIPKLTSLFIKEFKWITEDAIKAVVRGTPLLQLKLDPREFNENLESEIKEIRPECVMEHVIEYDYDQQRGIHSVADAYIPFAHEPESDYFAYANEIRNQIVFD
ncbi:hypothetical protein Ocin01_00529 [Orchesella cincta]|uniref:F-box domain-containing protein n=1 Tax=Orchesella cincta TaxID=48709 RepID=A0A1D2NLP7_ORCCI|nr:hypothetical protein Ocin01_00529 [Orchesella cincta]